MNCIRCGVPIKRTRTKAGKKGKCRKSCDGIPKDSGGWPLDPVLREQYRQKRRLVKEFKASVFHQPTVITRTPLGERKQITEVPVGKEFYLSREWRELRYRTLLAHGRKCMCCHRSDLELHVDHIKPISKYRRLALDFNNLQVLCVDCNLGKSNKDETDFRKTK